MIVQSSEFRVQKEGNVRSFQDLLAWKKSIDLVKPIYKLTSKFPKSEDFNLTSQIRRATISVSSNIAEGSSRKSKQEFIRFLNVSYGSLSEIESQLLVSKELEYLSDKELKEIFNKTSEIGKIINGLIESLRSN